MKLLRPTLALLVFGSLAFGIVPSASAGQFVPPSPQALNALQKDLVNAIESMKSALPIYDGNRVRSMREAREALIIVDRSIYGNKAAVRQKLNSTDSVKSSAAKSNYTAEQISASQTNMRQGLSTLQTAWNDLVTAAGSNPNAKAKMVGKHLQTAAAEAKTAISLHSTQS